ncbi:MAG: hypothetical protein KDC53_02620 [Saprospiraceae bacterium]|nr:hypothetical protein [Saprospiraceae bacterium]
MKITPIEAHLLSYPIPDAIHLLFCEGIRGVLTDEDKSEIEPFVSQKELFQEPLNIAGGYLLISNLCGHTMDLDESVLNKYPFIPGTWLFFDQKKPKQTFALTGGDHSVKWVNENQI